MEACWQVWGSMREGKRERERKRRTKTAIMEVLTELELDGGGESAPSGNADRT